MAITHIGLLKIFFFCSIFFVGGASRSLKTKITRWCNQTPHPLPCRYFMSRSHQHFPLKHRSDFRKITIQVALERALIAQRQIIEFKPNCQNLHQKTVWADCFKLHSNTVLQLNRTLQGLKNRKMCTDFDAQTWLSTALTNIQTCQIGSSDLHVSDFIMPIMSNNLSELISNSLAVNGVLLATEDGNKEGFPSWFSRHKIRLLQSTSIARANLVVAKDGSGNFTTIQAAINAAARRRYGTRFIIHVKRGLYRENIEIGINNNNIWLVGDGIRNTIITSSRSVGGGYTTYSSATAGIDGLRFVARGVTFSNTAGPLKGQAVALRSSSDLSVFYRCAFQGYQDTLFVHSQRQFYKECYIYGTVDFIFGNAAVVLQNSLIFVRKPLKGQANVITAQGRNDPFQNTGISIHNSQILPAPELKPVVRSVQTYMGRPWMQYSRTVVLKTYLDSFISPAGWLRWDNTNFALDTLYYGEYKNFGPGASTKWRVNWKGFHTITSAAIASRFTVKSLISGQSWLPTTRVPFTAGL